MPILACEAHILFPNRWESVSVLKVGQNPDAPLFDFPAPFPQDRRMRSRMVPMLPRMGIFGSFVFAIACLTLSHGCALLFPDRTAPKNSSYKVTPPGTPWQKVAVGEDSNGTDAMRADMAYENPQTGAIISLNSLCRKYNKTSLEQLTENLVRGIGEKKEVSRREVEIDGSKAIDTLFEGVVDGVFLHLRTVVLIKNDCTFDFIHVTVPKREPNNAKTFDEFLASFHAG